MFKDILKVKNAFHLIVILFPLEGYSVINGLCAFLVCLVPSRCHTSSSCFLACGVKEIHRMYVSLINLWLHALCRLGCFIDL